MTTYPEAYLELLPWQKKRAEVEARRRANDDEEYMLASMQLESAEEHGWMLVAEEADQRMHEIYMRELNDTVDNPEWMETLMGDDEEQNMTKGNAHV